jgi:hypothetical protein
MEKKWHQIKLSDTDDLLFSGNEISFNFLNIKLKNKVSDPEIAFIKDVYTAGIKHQQWKVSVLFNKLMKGGV